ncbi:MAG: uracil-DNA glycosylase [candidate division Zixibacteria bacterium]|nr:uracil-DNA glycosylase [candidate division Zixibacteria bacterium]
MEDKYIRMMEAFALTKKYLKQQMDLGLEEIQLSPDFKVDFERKRESRNSLEDLYHNIKDCQKCQLYESRTNFVFGTGNSKAEVMFIGEAPGRDEDLQGEPFVGRAGQLLNKILAAINFEREEVYIGNVLKCRPPENRDPLPDEIEKCEPYLIEQIKLIQPKLICALGRIAAQALLKTKQPLNRLRGSFHDYQGIKFMVTYHPAALLRYPQFKKDTWEDVKLLRSEYDRMIGNRS